MFGFFESKKNNKEIIEEKVTPIALKEANIYFGSTIQSRDSRKYITNPYTKKGVTSAPICNKEDALKALNIAQSAFKNSKSTALSQRILWLEDVAKIIESKKEEFALTLTDEVAKPIAFSRVEVDRCIETIKLTAYELANLHGETIPTDIMPSGKKTISFFRREPVGVVVCITPFNFPLNLVVHKIAPALGAGNAVVLKPTPEAPMIAFMLADVFIKSKYAPKDMLSVVYGDAEVGSALVSSSIPRVISFTGSVPVGKIIMAQAGIKKVSLELGGNAATLIDKSADLNLAASRCAFGAFINSGQVCISLQRIYVHRDVYDEFSSLLAEHTAKLKVGNPYDEDTFIGPLIDEESKQRASSWIKNAVNEGANIVSLEREEEGKKIDNNSEDNNIFNPTIMTNVTDEMKIVCEEVFAPIVSLIAIDSYEEAMEKINNSDYGLQFSIFTNDLKMTQRFIEDANCGGVVINDIPTLRFDVQPYGGSKLSGVGREGPKYTLEEFTEIKSIVIC